MSEPSGQPGRYQRSSSGLLAAMLVLLLVIVAFVGFRGITRGNQDNPPDAVPFSGLAEQVRETGDRPLTAPTPDPLPQGWRVTSARFERGDRPGWHLGILTADQTYVAVEEQRARAGDLVGEFLGKQSAKDRTVEAGGHTWQAWTRSGGEGLGGYALTRKTEASVVFVGGPAGEKAVLELTRTLTSD